MGAAVRQPPGVLGALLQRQLRAHRAHPAGALSLLIKAFEPGDARRVRELFIAVNRLLAPPGMHAEFEAYIERALREEIDRIAEYYREGGFWVALEAEVLVGTFGL